MGSFAATLLSFLWTIVLARLVSEEVHGQLQACMGLLALTMLVAQFGWVATTIQQIRNGVSVGIAYGMALTATAVGVVCVYLFFGPNAQWVASRLLLGVPTRAMWLLFFIAGSVLVTQISGAVSRSHGEFPPWERTKSLGVVVKTVLLIAVACFLTVNTEQVLFLSLLSSVVAMVYIIWVQWAAGRAPRWCSSTALWTKGIVYSAKSAATTIGGEFHQRADLLLLAYFTEDAGIVGCYAIAVGTTNRLKIIPLALAATLHPMISGAPEEHKVEPAQRAIRMALWGAVFLAVGVGGATPFFLPLLFGAQFEEAVPMVLFLLPGTVAVSVFWVVGRYFQAIDQQEVNVATIAIAVVLNLSLNLLLIPRFGGAGAAIASSISYTLQGGVVFFVFCWRTQQWRSAVSFQWADWRELLP